MLTGWQRGKPYVYSDAEIDALLRQRWLCRQRAGCADGPTIPCSG